MNEELNSALANFVNLITTLIMLVLGAAFWALVILLGLVIALPVLLYVGAFIAGVLQAIAGA